MTEPERGSQARWWKQLSTLTQRSFVNMSRDIGYYWLRIIIYTVVSICVGTIFFNVGTGYTAILARGACGGFISGFMTFMSIGGFPSFIEEMKVTIPIQETKTPMGTLKLKLLLLPFLSLKQVFYRERLNGHYGILVFILSNFFSSLPFLIGMSLTTTTIIYYMVKLQPGFLHYMFTFFILLSSIAVVESIMMIVASLVPNFLLGIAIGAGIIVRKTATSTFL